MWEGFFVVVVFSIIVICLASLLDSEYLKRKLYVLLIFAIFVSPPRFSFQYSQIAAILNVNKFVLN